MSRVVGDVAVNTKKQRRTFREKAHIIAHDMQLVLFVAGLFLFLTYLFSTYHRMGVRGTTHDIRWSDVNGHSFNFCL